MSPLINTYLVCGAPWYPASPPAPNTANVARASRLWVECILQGLTLSSSCPQNKPEASPQQKQDTKQDIHMSDGWRDEDRGDPEVIHAAVWCPPRAVTVPAREPCLVQSSWPGLCRWGDVSGLFWRPESWGVIPGNSDYSVFLAKTSVSESGLSNPPRSAQVRQGARKPSDLRPVSVEATMAWIGVNTGVGTEGWTWGRTH